MGEKESRNLRVSFYLKKTEFDKLITLSNGSGIKNWQVFMTQKLILPYARRMNPKYDHARTPLPQKLQPNKAEKMPLHLMLTSGEKNQLDKLIQYHYFINPTTGKNMYSKFFACLIIQTYNNRFVEEQHEDPESISSGIDLSVLGHDDEDWSGED